MWLLENLGDSFQGRRLWLRPGKLYLLGRTAAEPGQLAISDKTISRKHLTIRVDNVKEGDGMNRNTRTPVTVEDLGTKIGTLVNGVQIKGQKHVLSGDSNEIKLGHCNKLFRVTWHNVTLSFSFTSRELRDDPWAKLREQLEPLDIKYSAEYDIALTTHVVAKKRNTSKGLQALINGKYIVIESFITAILEAAKAPEGGDGSEPSPLERDFDANWPVPMQHLPPRGEEPITRPIRTYAPDERRKDIFDGYTFVFYEKKQYENLFPPITNGKGKALLKEVTPGETQVDEFVRYVKEVAGEKGLGEFEDGSEGKGVVVVRHVPVKGENVDWFVNFTTAVSLKLDHRLIEQREFLDAILTVQPGMLRRPLELEPDPVNDSFRSQPRPISPESGMEFDGPPAVPPPAEHAGAAVEAGGQAVEELPKARMRSGRTRRPVASRFKGFDADVDPDNSALADPPRVQKAQATDGSDMFVSQESQAEVPPEGSGPARTAQRKRRAPFGEDDVMEDIAPTAAAVKRRRIAAGEDPVAPAPDPDLEDEEAVPETPQEAAKPQAGKKKKGKETNILELARQRREEAERRAAEERQRLEHIPEDGLDFEEIRKLTIVEDFDVRQPSESRTRDQDIADGRWDPRWNGRRNFKKFRRQGDPAGRPVQRVIVGIEPVKLKEYGVGDDYWLEDSGDRRRRTDSGGEPEVAESLDSHARPGDKGKRREEVEPQPESIVIDSDGEGEDVVITAKQAPEPERDLPRTRAGKAAERASARQAQSQSQSRPQRQNKRPAAAPPARAQPAKRPRRVAEAKASDDSDDELQFRFGKR